MWPYWMLYSIPALLVLFVVGSERRLQLTPLFWMILGAFFAFFIGFRYQVGGDWGNYLGHYDYALGKPLIEAIALGKDPGYAFLNWLMAKWGLEIYAVNLVCGAIFISGLIIFCRQQVDPLLAFTVAVPYLVIVVAMGYTRQGAALGLLFWAIASLEQGKLWQYVALIGVGALFHKTLLIMLPFGVLLSGQTGVFRAGAILLAGYGLWDAFLAQEQGRLFDTYVTDNTKMISEGAEIRVLMNVLPSLLLLIYWKRWKQFFPNHWFWFWIAIASVISFGLVGYASTAVDRIALYFAPIQLAVYSRLAHLPLLPGRQLDPGMVSVTIVLAYATVLYVWLNYAGHAYAWIPYQNILFQ